MSSAPTRCSTGSTAAAGQALRVGDYKAWRPEPGAPLQLYDLSTDPAESVDVAEAHPDVIARCEALLLAERTPNEFFPLLSP